MANEDSTWMSPSDCDVPVPLSLMKKDEMIEVAGEDSNWMKSEWNLARPVQFGDNFYNCNFASVEDSKNFAKDQHKKQIEESYRLLSSKLKERYKQNTLPKVHWLDHGSDFNLKDYYVNLEQAELKNRNTSEPIKLEDMFDQVDGEFPRRILIEGQPGMGKTTLSSKLAFDWAMGGSYLKRFDALIVVPLRHLEELTIEDAIDKINETCNGQPFNFHHLHDDALEKTCLVLDGFDELPECSKEDVLQVLYKTRLSSTTVVVTCRSGQMPIKESSTHSKFFPIQKKAFYDRKISILGINDEARRQFLLNYCSPEMTQKIIDLFKKTARGNNTDMLKRPLILMMIVYLVEKEDLHDFDLKLSSLLKKLINCVVRCSLARDGVELTSLNLFDLTDGSSRLYQKRLAQFGKICFKQLMQRNYCAFEVNDLSKQIYSMGLLVNDVTIKHFDIELHFECFHSIILEFLAAYYFWRKMEMYGMSHDCLNCEFKQLCNFSLRRDQNLVTRLVNVTFDEELYSFNQNCGIPIDLVFLCGLRQRKSKDFIEWLQTVDYAFKNLSVWNMIMLAEVEDPQLAKNELSVLFPLLHRCCADFSCSEISVQRSFELFVVMHVILGCVFSVIKYFDFISFYSISCNYNLYEC